MKKGLIKNLLLLFIMLSSLTLLSCSNTSKKNKVLEATNLSASVYENENYTLPNEVNISILDKQLLLPVKWNNTNIDTSTPGTFTYEGYDSKLGSKVVLELTVLENVYTQQIGYIKNIYKNRNQEYVDVDLIEFYHGDIAVREAIKDNKAVLDDDGSYYVYNGYYIRNTDESTITYEISDDCIFTLLPFDLNPKASSLDDMVDVNYDEFVNHRKKNDRYLYYIDIKNNEVYSIKKIFLP